MSYHQKSCIYFRIDAVDVGWSLKTYLDHCHSLQKGSLYTSQNVLFYNSTVSRIPNTEVAGKLVILFLELI